MEKGALRLHEGMAKEEDTMVRLFKCAGIVLLLAAAGCSPVVRQAPTFAEMPTPAVAGTNEIWPGRQSDGSMLLPNQWSLRPVGRQVTLGDFPVNLAVHPKGQFAAVLHSGDSEHQIIIVDLLSATVVSQFALHETFYG